MQQESRALAFSLLNKRLGELPADLRARIEALSL
ncbi:DUF4351 domain-containing protein [Oscillatoria sp. CS-180]